MQKEVAERAGILLRQYQRYEGGQNIMQAAFAVTCRVLRALELDINEFYNENGKSEE